MTRLKNSKTSPKAVATQNKVLLSETTPILKHGLYSSNSEMNMMLGVIEKLLHWAAIIDSSDDAIISKSLDGFITSWNRGAERLYGYAPAEVIGKPISILMPSEKENDFPYILKQLKEGKRVEHYETKRLTKDGRVLNVSITVSPIRDSNGNLIGASKIARDITERVEMERRREEFVSTASHELKTPITSQKIFGELLEKLIVKNGHKEYLPYITKMNLQTKKLEKLIDDLLEHSRIQTGRLQMEYKPFKMDGLVDEIVDDMQKTTKHDIQMIGKTGKTVYGDRDRLGQVFQNLISNAIKYSPNADKLVIESRAEGENVVISVRDFGIGIPREYHEKIFERFFRVAGVDEKTYPGMGIGLDFSREVVTRHHGTITVKSSKGKGSTFSVTLPLRRSKK